jgi:hypothetical protein
MAKAGGIAPLVALLDEGTQVDDADCYRVPPSATECH